MASHQKSQTNFTLDESQLFVLSQNISGCLFVYATQSIKISSIQAEAFGNFILEESSYEDWVHIFSALESNLVESHDLNQLKFRVKEVLNSDLYLALGFLHQFERFILDLISEFHEVVIQVAPSYSGYR